MSLSPIAEESGKLFGNTEIVNDSSKSAEPTENHNDKTEEAKPSLKASVLKPLEQLLKAADTLPAMGNSLLGIIKELSANGDNDTKHTSVFTDDTFDPDDIFETSEKYYEEEIDDNTELRTSETHPIDVDFVTIFPLKSTRISTDKKGKHKIPVKVDGTGRLGMSSAPGKQVKNEQYTWYRDLELDIRTLKDFHKVDVLVSLMMPDEYQALNMSSLSETCLKYDIQPIFFPIQDQQIPYLFQYPQFKNLIKYIVHSVQYENKCVVVHCRRGKGRTGMVVACCLVYAGFSPDKSIRHCRKIRPKTVKNIKQEDYVIDFYESITEERKRKHLHKLAQKEKFKKKLIKVDETTFDNYIASPDGTEEEHNDTENSLNVLNLITDLQKTLKEDIIPNLS